MNTRLSFRTFFIVMTLVFAVGITTATIAAAQMTAASTPDFIRAASITNLFARDASRMAVQKSKTPDVNQFAQQLLADHTKSSDALLSAAEHSGADPTLVAGTLDDTHKKMMDELNDASDNSFDRKFVADIIAEHQQSIPLFRNYSQLSDKGPVKSYATDALPMLQGHLDHAMKLDH